MHGRPQKSPENLGNSGAPKIHQKRPSKILSLHLRQYAANNSARGELLFHKVQGLSSVHELNNRDTWYRVHLLGKRSTGVKKCKYLAPRSRKPAFVSLKCISRFPLCFEYRPLEIFIRWNSCLQIRCLFNKFGEVEVGIIYTCKFKYVICSRSELGGY